MLFKVRVVVTVGGQHLEGDRGPSWLGGGADNVLFLDLCGGYMNVFTI